ncbi:MAG: UTP--glucose-1-phosphate uridylyltransferase, partial [bacterium]|nr:UTP--glucose-1-phosphate uridylyltransferase [bacterium]
MTQPNSPIPAPVRKAILPVAGWGTRFLPATKAQPKEMLPIVDKPVIQFLVEEAVASGIKEIIFVTGRNKRAIEDHFDHNGELDTALRSKGKDEVADRIRSIADLAKFSYVRQREARGPGDAVLAARHLVGEEPVAVLYGDDVAMEEPPLLARMIDVYCTYGAPVVALREVPRSEVTQYGVAKIEKSKNSVCRILDLIEKPTLAQAPSRNVVIGKFILTPEIFDFIEKSPLVQGELYLTDALRMAATQSGLYGYIFKGRH